MRRTVLLLLAACVLFAVTGFAHADKPIKIVVVTGGHGYQKEPFVKMFQSFKGIEFVHHELPKNTCDVFEDVSKWDYDAIVLYNMSQPLTDKQKANFLSLLDKGVGLVALHHCIAAFETWDEYPKIIGGRYFRKQNKTRPAEQPLSKPTHGVMMDVKVVDTKHPVTAGVSDFTLKDETYQNQAFEKDNHILLTCDNPTSDKTIGWTRTYRASRVCYIELGHDGIAYADANYRKLLTNAIRWTAAGTGGPKAGGPTAPPAGFTALFNGKDLTGWKALVGNPKTRAKMGAEKLAAAQKVADAEMPKHWKIIDGVLEYDGEGKSLCTAKDYADFEMFVDWKIHAKGDSGIYLRGAPQVQIWDPAQRPEGSGGLFNNKKNPSKPLKCADNPIGEWNTFRIKMVGERVSVWLNGVLAVDNVVMENYWDRSNPIYPTGQIELQHHNSKLWFRNIFIREIPRDAAKENTK